MINRQIIANEVIEVKLREAQRPESSSQEETQMVTAS